MILDFRSDNTASADPKLLNALLECNNIANVNPYGADSLTNKLDKLLTNITCKKVKTITCMTGTACNLLAISLLTPNYGSVICHKYSHLALDEASGPELVTGAKLVLLNKEHKICSEELEQNILTTRAWAPHSLPVKTLVLTFSNEWGLIYSTEELRKIKTICKKYQIKIHIDGARLANGLVASKMTLNQFIDTIEPSTIAIGVSKNGGIFGDPLIVLDEELFEPSQLLQKKYGHMLSKARYTSAQFLSYFTNNHWLDSATRANKQAEKLAKMISGSDLTLYLPRQTNMVFVVMKPEQALKLRSYKVLFHDWSIATDCFRFVCSPNTSDDEISKLSKILKQL